MQAPPVCTTAMPVSAHLHTCTVCTACTPVQLVLLVDGEFLLGIITVSYRGPRRGQTCERNIQEFRPHL